LCSASVPIWVSFFSANYLSSLYFIRDRVQAACVHLLAKHRLHKNHLLPADGNVDDPHAYTVH
jgi:hypothetical protein